MEPLLLALWILTAGALIVIALALLPRAVAVGESILLWVGGALLIFLAVTLFTNYPWLIPVALGLGVCAYLYVQEFELWHPSASDGRPSLVRKMRLSGGLAAVWVGFFVTDLLFAGAGTPFVMIGLHIGFRKLGVSDEFLDGSFARYFPWVLFSAPAAYATLMCRHALLERRAREAKWREFEELSAREQSRFGGDRSGVEFDVPQNTEPR